MRVIKNEYNIDWEANRQPEMRKLLQEGTVPYKADVAKHSYGFCMGVPR